SILGFLLLPALNAYSRFNERQADRYAFQSIASIEPYFFDEQARRPESRRTHTFQIRGMVLSLTSRDCKADRCGRKLGGASARECTSIAAHVHWPRKLCSNCRKSSSVSTPMLS